MQASAARGVALAACALCALRAPCFPEAPLQAEPAQAKVERLGAGLPVSGQWRHGFDLADLDGDGHLDLVHGPPRTGDPLPVIFRGDGRGGFDRWQTATYPPLAYDYGDAATGDFDGDGRLDIALGTHLGQILVLRSSGGGAFTEGSDDAFAGFSSRAIEAVDWDGDGRLDLAALGEGPAPTGGRDASRGLAVFLNRPAGWVRLGPQGRHFGNGLSLGDLDRDGHPDAVTPSMVLGDGAVIGLGAGAAGWRVQSLEGLGERSLVPAVAVADLDRDGRDDVAAAVSRLAGETWSSSIELFLTVPGKAPRRVVLAEATGALAFHALGAGKLDGIAPGLVALGEKGAIHIWTHDGETGLVRLDAPELETAGAGCRGAHVRLADLTGDGRDELVVAFADQRCESKGSLQVWRMY